MKILVYYFAFSVAACFAWNSAWPQQPGARDAAGCSDPPFFSRPANYYISTCAVNEDREVFRMADGQALSAADELMSITYVFDDQSGSRAKSRKQIVRYYKSAVEALGGSTLTSDSPAPEGDAEEAFVFQKDGNNYYLKLSDIGSNPLYQFSVAVVTRQP